MSDTVVEALVRVATGDPWGPLPIRAGLSDCVARGWVVDAGGRWEPTKFGVIAAPLAPLLEKFPGAFGPVNGGFLAWMGARTVRDVWEECPRGDWMAALLLAAEDTPVSLDALAWRLAGQAFEAAMRVYEWDDPRGLYVREPLSARTAAESLVIVETLDEKFGITPFHGGGGESTAAFATSAIRAAIRVDLCATARYAAMAQAPYTPGRAQQQEDDAFRGVADFIRGGVNTRAAVIAITRRILRDIKAAATKENA